MKTPIPSIDRIRELTRESYKPFPFDLLNKAIETAARGGFNFVSTNVSNLHWEDIQGAKEIYESQGYYVNLTTKSFAVSW